MAFVIVQIKTNGAGGAGVVEIRGIPAAIAPKRVGTLNNANQADIGNAQYFDAGTAAYLGLAYCVSSTAIRMYLASSVDLSLTIANGDAMQVNMVYELA